ncbi:MAG: NAD-glutamate dehydrogenase domain-containing protein [Candidatus Sericytochromatia bacterium]|nr:NAD-glutamate dehydrogenase domain-containing protein [Candidatus Sericytochromatia bacterium]
MEATRDMLARRVGEALKGGLEEKLTALTDWFYQSMPDFYFEFTPEHEQARHLQTILMGQVFENRQSAIVRSADGSRLVCLGPADDPDALLDMLRQVGRALIASAEVYSSRDGKLLLAVFQLTPDEAVDRTAPEAAPTLAAAALALKNFVPAHELERYFDNLPHDYVLRSSVDRIVRHATIFHQSRSLEGTHVGLNRDAYPDVDRLDVAVTNVRAVPYMHQVVRLLRRFGVGVARGFLNILDDGTHEKLAMMTLYINEEQTGGKPQLDESRWLSIQKAIHTLKWVEEDDLSVMNDEDGLTLNETNFLRAAAEYAHVFLSKVNLYYYTVPKIKWTMLHHRPMVLELIKAFKARFDPRLAEAREARIEAADAAMVASIDRVGDKVEKRIWQEIFRFVCHIFKTNYFILDKTGLAFRMDPEVLDTQHYPDRPFGFFYFYGKDYRGFHVRWKDMARGGMRLVIPRSPEAYDRENDRLFDEVKSLSWAQQLKNKDIPEGGAKGVLLLKPQAVPEIAVRGAVDSLLDLLVTDADGHLPPEVVDRYGQREYIYLGPDENITNEMISWIVDQARAKGYRYPDAFMSSKPGTGINHKEFGVTSEGVNVYLEHGLRYLGIDPAKDTFTVKVTGGPDGDVAGNILKIMARDYGERARVVAIADGYGCAVDPKGLDPSELMRLVREGLSIVHFDVSRLSTDPGAFMRRADDDEGVALRNDLHNRVEADVFIPAGGRPETIKGSNWNRFLKADGTPSSRLIVEGANIFLTEEARLGLEQKGVVIIKDSSANKAGVICSSFEILAALAIGSERFTEIRGVYISEVIGLLRRKAAQEATLLFREWDACGRATPLSKLSYEISRVINRLAGIIEEGLARVSDPLPERYREIVLEYCPPSLARRFPDEVLSQIPQRHQRALLAKHLASTVVYREGLDWLDQLATDPEQVFKVVETYMEQADLAERFIAEVRASELPGRADIVRILDLAGRRELTRLALRRGHSDEPAPDDLRTPAGIR